MAAQYAIDFLAEPTRDELDGPLVKRVAEKNPELADTLRGARAATVGAHHALRDAREARATAARELHDDPPRKVSASSDGRNGTVFDGSGSNKTAFNGSGNNGTARTSSTLKARALFMGRAFALGYSLSRATSSTIMITKPAMTPSVPMFECSPRWASGMSSSTTT